MSTAQKGGASRGTSVPDRVVAIVQARLASTRLPGKTLKPLAGQPMLARVVERVGRAKGLAAVVVATTTSPKDEPIADLCRSRGWCCERGSEDDVLDRYYRAAKKYDSDLVVRVTADCPIVDPLVVDRTVEEYRRVFCDYASNLLEPRSFPRGLEAEVFSLDALETAWREDTKPEWREHVTPYIYRHPEKFRLHRVDCESNLSFHRWTVDTSEDYELVRRIYDFFGHDRFHWMEVVHLLEQHPEWVAINQSVKQKVVP